MKFLKENLPWMAPTAAVILLATGFLDRDSSQEPATDRTPVVAAAPVAAITPEPAAAQVAVAVPSPTAPSPTAPDASAADVLADLVAQTSEVTRAAPQPTFVAPEPVVEASVDTSIIDDPAAFFAGAQANLSPQDHCGDDLRALAESARIYFPSGGLAGADAGLAQARLMGQVLGSCPGFAVIVGGHSDPSGDPAINLELSQQRAESVVARLAASGIDTSRFTARGFGDQQPSGLTGPEGPEYYDRRVEFTVVVQPEEQFDAPAQVETAQVATAQVAPVQSLSACALQLEPLVAQTKGFYSPNSITLPAADLDQVMRLATEAARCGDVKLRIIGQHANEPGARESATQGRMRALAIMNTLVASGFDSDNILLGAPSWSQDIPGQPGLPNSRVDFQLVPSEG